MKNTNADRVGKPKNRNLLSNLRWRGLTFQVFVLIIVPLSALLVIITLGSLNLHQNAMRTMVGERDVRVARTAANALSAKLDHHAAIVHSLALRAADHTSPTDILSLSEPLLQDFDYGLAFYSSDGSLLSSTGNTTIWGPIHDVITTLLTDPQTYLSDDPLFSKPWLISKQASFIVILISTTTAENPVAVGVFSIASLAFHTLHGAIASGEQASIILVGQNHEVLFSAGDLSQNHSGEVHPGVQEALNGESGATYLQEGDSELVIAFSPVQPTGWALVIEEPWEEVTSPLLRATQVAPLLLVPVLIFSLLTLWFSVRQIVQPLRELKTRSTALAWGDFEAVDDPVGGIDEIQSLQRELMYLAHKVQSAQEGLHGYIGAITSGQEEERRRLARELHDDTLQSLIALNQRVQLARLSPGEGKEDETMSEIQTLIEQTIQELRRITRALRPLYLEDLGLVTALDMLVKETVGTSGLSVKFNFSGNEKRLSDTIELALYRISQEGLSNITRHAQAENASINLDFSPIAVTLTISDDGKGFETPESPAEFAHDGHFGLLGLYERAELIGARADILSVLGKGTQLTIMVPIKQQDQD
jgi:signal transduction histidine kinase